MKNEILQELSEYTKQYGIVERDEFTALYYAQKFSLSRNTVSQYLNEAIANGKLIKVNSRPVYFFHKKRLEETYKKICDGNSFSSFDELHAFFFEQIDDFEELIGYDNSLSSVVAVSYTHLDVYKRQVQE